MWAFVSNFVNPFWRRMRQVASTIFREVVRVGSAVWRYGFRVRTDIRI